MCTHRHAHTFPLPPAPFLICQHKRIKLKEMLVQEVNWKMFTQSSGNMKFPIRMCCGASVEGQRSDRWFINLLLLQAAEML